MNGLRVTTCALVVVVLACLATSSMAQRRSSNRRGIFFRLSERRRTQEKREEQAEQAACFVLSGLFTRRLCADDVNPICRAYAYLLKNGENVCEKFPCSGYGSDSRSVCVREGTCSRLTLRNGLCSAGDECCIPA